MNTMHLCMDILILIKVRVDRYICIICVVGPCNEHEHVYIKS